ncbi:MAG: hypothetical protein LBQ01_09630 [Prevotellaceae bacterium]|jgi:Leucine-rich repeat (LRR) protein|nr:hypothetical protein [Prevotellaceae bacterium]
MKQILLIVCVFTVLTSCSDNENAAPDLNVNPSIIELDNVESTRKIYVSSNTSWEVSSSDPNWCAISILRKFGNDTVEITVEGNSTYNERIAYISVSNPEKTVIKTVKVIQKSLGRSMLRKDDSMALVKFYDSTGGDGWAKNAGWKISNLENWHGVVIRDDRVTGIKLENNNLSGKLISGLGNLSMLDTFSIVSEKGVTGSIPASIAGLSNLLYLNISGTSIAGDIPPQLGSLSALEELILSENLNFTGRIPKKLGDLSSLKKLVINNLPDEGGESVIPPELRNLHNLEYLALDSCNLSNIAVEIFGLTNLEYLSLNNNKIQTLSQNITALTKLKHLILSNNNFMRTIPAELADLELITLHLDNNYFNGIIPDAILNKIDGNSFKVCPQKFGFSSFDNHPCD